MDASTLESQLVDLTLHSCENDIEKKKEEIKQPTSK